MERFASVSFKFKGFMASSGHLLKLSQSKSLPSQLYKAQLKQSALNDAVRVLAPWGFFYFASKYNELKLPFLIFLSMSYTFFPPRFLNSSVYLENKFKKLEPKRKKAATIIFEDFQKSLSSFSSTSEKNTVATLERAKDVHMLNLKQIEKVFFNDKSAEKVSFLNKDKKIINAYMHLYALPYSFLFPRTRLLQMFSKIATQDNIARDMDYVPTTAYGMLTERVRELGVIEPHYANATESKIYKPLGWDKEMLASKYMIYKNQLKELDKNDFQNYPAYGTLLTAIAATKFKESNKSI